ncbi:SWIM zinc finger family protein [Tsukamurella paurometabola]|uniref:SWIM zinc finger family protein n=1 Tax=Tsukamurella paurometabola TaxID=2061 RepID=A0ABS5N608_TSUPA|nr:SWIM zinc finger family protein [Tsukamurella paurometabola]MBS4099705.1 SWIM zinc finger family protein [Tsukamurella paurometabola]UEA83711.1 SWIM zinc finger domain-containing protein [Tsukamurella paurometabola]
MGVERWSREQVLSLAPDAASEKAGTKLGVPGPWTLTGATDSAVWGNCQGSGKRPYQTVVELAGPAYKCSCPSRKFPCKHALGLLLLWADATVPDASEPADFAAEWLAARDRRREDSADRAAIPRDPDRAARTAAQRSESVAGGVAELRLWLLDQVHSGLAGIDASVYERVDPLARRLVDAKAPGLAGRVRALSAAVVGPRWPERIVQELGLLWLLTRGHDRLDQLDGPVAAAVRRHVGYPVATADVLAGPSVTDDWTVLGTSESEADRITTRTTWLRAASSGRWASVLDFKAPGGPPLPLRPPIGTTVRAELAFYPDGLRAIPRGDLTPTAPAPSTAPSDWATALAERAARCADDPWHGKHPVLVAGRPATAPEPCLIDAQGTALPLTISAPAWWMLLAGSGGASVTVAGLLGPEALEPMSMIAGDEVLAL